MTKSDYHEFCIFEQEDTLNILDYSGQEWCKMNPTRQEEIVEEIFDFYRNKHGFPYQTLTEERIEKELWKLKKKKPKFDGTKIIWDNTGIVLCSYYFPHLYEVPLKGRSAIDVFNNDESFRKIIRFCLAFKNKVTPNNIVSSLNLATGIVSRFKPMVAKAIYDRYAPPGGLIYDYACGWGAGY